MLPPDLIPFAFDPKQDTESLSPTAAHQLLERYRVLAMAMAARAMARHWDTGLVASEATASLVENAVAPLPYEQEVLALIGVSQGRASAHLEEAERGVVQALVDLTEAERVAGSAAPLSVIGREFGLSTVSKMTLMLIAAPAIWGSVHSLYRLVANDSSRPVVDEYLLTQLFGPQINPHLLAGELQPGAPLLASGLVDIDAGSPPVAALRVSPLVVARLRGDPLVRDPSASVPDELPRKLSSLVMPDPAVVSLVQWSTKAPKNTRLVLRGRAGSGRMDILRTLAARADRRLHVVNLAMLDGNADAIIAQLRFQLHRCRVAGWVACITEVQAAVERAGAARIAQVLDSHAGPVCLRLLPEENPPLAPGYHLVELGQLSQTARDATWRQELAAVGLAVVAAESLAIKWRVGPGIIRQVAARVSSESPAPDAVAAAADSAVIQHLQSKLGDVAERITKLPALSDMVLPGDIMDSLTEFIARNRLGKQVFENWGMDQVATTGRGLTALFQGAPGTGKTMVAGALAHELGLDLYRVDLSRILSKWIGETERNLSNIFAAAEDGHAIILFDEADSLFTKRTEVKSSNDRHSNVEVNYLLQRLDSFTGIAILTTNFGTSIDAAFKRRLSFRLTFPVPDEEIREQLWRKHLPPSLPTGKLDLADLARKYHFAGGAVRNCVLRAAFLAAAEGKSVTQEHLVRAIRLEYRSNGKLSEGGPLE